ncbi:MAG: TetR/AcrR family transcriptional regulator [Anaerolineae bacterium]|nr:TetR/AcrR family transcriptional regulator [Anaerolineae bacterium]
MGSERHIRKVDRRIKRTRRLLSEALVSLSLESSYDEISIRSLTQRADVGYATFYRHFKSKDELLTYCMRQVLHEIEKIVKPELSHYEESLAIFGILQRHKRICKLALNLPDDHPACVPVWEEIEQWLEELYNVRDETNIPQALAVNHMIKSCRELARWWLNLGESYSTEQMAIAQAELVMKVIESVALNPREKAKDFSPVT